MSKNFKKGAVYVVYGKPENERKAVAMAECIDPHTTLGKVKFLIKQFNQKEMSGLLGKELKRGFFECSFNAIDSLKDGVEYQFCQKYISKTDKYLTINSININ